MSTHLTVQQVIGRNVRRLRLRKEGVRANWTQSDLADAARSHGLAWTQGTVAAIEGGTRSVPLEELPLLAWTLMVNPVELFRGDEYVELTEEATVKLRVFRQMFSGEWGNVRLGDLDTPGTRGMKAGLQKALVDMREHAELWPGASALDVSEARRDAERDAEQKAARRLDIHPLRVSVAAHGLWGRGLTDERDARLETQVSKRTPARTVQAVRGHITRQLLTELQDYITERTRRGKH